jgi:MFS family permease
MEQFEYRIYPLLLLGFFRVANIVIINLTIPIFFFQLGYSPGIIGIINSAMNFIYIFSPLLLRAIPEKIGNKLSLIICLVGITALQFFYQFTNNPYLFILLRILEGLLLGLFWPVLNSSISILTSFEDNSSTRDELIGNKLIRKYSLSWNLGSVFSFLLGSFLLFFIEDVNLMFDISFLYILTCLILTFLFQEPNKFFASNYEKSSEKQLRNKSKKFSNVEYSALIPFFLIIVYGLVEHSNGLIYPLKYEILNFPLFINYLSSFVLITFQTIFTYKGMNIPLRKLKKIALLSIGILCIVLFLSGINSNIIIFLIAFGAFGTSLAFLYCFSFKLIILKNILENTSKYGFYFESFISLSFFLGTFLGGFFANFGINFAFIILSLITLGCLIIYVVVKRYINLANLKNSNVK